MEKLKDIKGLMVIQEYSLFILLALALVVLLILFFILKKLLFKKRKISQSKLAKEQLKNLDFTNSKQCSYMLTKYAFLLAPEGKCKELENLLEKYKYKKDEAPFNDDDLGEIKRFLEVYNV
jgi:flagellar biosynthesis/type III secretory pathway M-ring protein FliF/YscJ